jgi:hypothetical protein
MAQLKAKKMLGKYTLLEKIGEGGFGVVYYFIICWLKMVHYLRMPVVVVEAYADNPLREEAFNPLNLTVSNFGEGAARNIEIRIDTSRFEMDNEQTML